MNKINSKIKLIHIKVGFKCKMLAGEVVKEEREEAEAIMDKFTSIFKKDIDAGKAIITYNYKGLELSVNVLDKNGFRLNVGLSSKKLKRFKKIVYDNFKSVCYIDPDWYWYSLFDTI